MNEKNILFQLTTNLSFQRNKATPKVSLRPPLPDAEELAEPKPSNAAGEEASPVAPSPKPCRGPQEQEKGP